VFERCADECGEQRMGLERLDLNSGGTGSRGTRDGLALRRSPRNFVGVRPVIFNPAATKAFRNRLNS
jgi:hypothetical protein